MVSEGVLQPRTWTVLVKALFCVNRKRMFVVIVGLEADNNGDKEILCLLHLAISDS